MNIFKIALKIVSNEIGGIGAAIGGIAGGIGSWASGDSARKAQEEANKLTRELYYADREWNKPINQVSRLKEAGLNPNLIYGNGGVVAGNTSKGAPRMESIGGYDLDFIGAINAAAAAISMEKTKEETKNTKKEGDLIDERIKWQEIQNRIGEHDATIIERSPVVSTDKGTAPMVVRTLSNVAHKLVDKTDFGKGVKRVLNKPIDKPLTNTENNVNVNERSKPWFMKYSGKPWFMKY